jgi:hypothetical protein
VTLVGPDAAGGSGGDDPAGINKLAIAPIDHVPEWQPEPGTTPAPTVGGAGGDRIGRQWP